MHRLEVARVLAVAITRTGGREEVARAVGAREAAVYLAEFGRRVGQVAEEHRPWVENVLDKKAQPALGINLVRV